jgi:uncharacterized protein (DUF433 family)
VESVPGKVSGAYVVMGTRIPAQAAVDNVADGFTAEQIASEIYQGLPIEPARRVIAFAKRALVAHPA